MDISDTLAPTSDQLDAVDLLGGPRTFVIDSVARNSNPEQPINITLRDFPRVWRPGKSMRRVLAAAWGTDATAYAGRAVTLYCDPEVTFGRDKTGGTRISHLSHIDRPLSVPLIVKRGSVKPFTVQPLKEQPPTQQPEPEQPRTDLSTITDVDALRGMYRNASPARRKEIEFRVAELQEAEAGAANEPGDTLPEPFDGKDPWATGGAA